jgi:hypothetical protein
VDVDPDQIRKLAESDGLDRCDLHGLSPRMRCVAGRSSNYPLP